MARKEVGYEWCRSAIDEYGDIIDNHFSEELDALETDDDVKSIYPLCYETRLELVASWGNEDEGVTDRSWAAVEYSKVLKLPFLPKEFCNGHPVPQRFHKAFMKALRAGRIQE